MTPRQQKKAAERERYRWFRQSQRELVAKLRGKVRETRAARVHARRGMRERCRSERLAAGVRAKELRARLLAELRASVAAARQAGRDKCTADHAHARDLATAAERARAELAAERDYQRELRRLESYSKASAKKIRKNAHESLTQSDDQVRGNLPPELVHLFNRVRGSIKGSARRTRTEAFLQYAEENPGEVLEAMGDRSDEVIAALERDTRRASRARRHEELPEVPF